MQIRIEGTNNKGNVVFERELPGDVYIPADVARVVQTYNDEYPQAICFNIQLAFPDPEVIALKKEMRSIWQENGVHDIPGFIDTLFKRYIIKRPENAG